MRDDDTVPRFGAVPGSPAHRWGPGAGPGAHTASGVGDWWGDAVAEPAESIDGVIEESASPVTADGHTAGHDATTTSGTPAGPDSEKRTPDSRGLDDDPGGSVAAASPADDPWAVPSGNVGEAQWPPNSTRDHAATGALAVANHPSGAFAGDEYPTGPVDVDVQGDAAADERADERVTGDDDAAVGDTAQQSPATSRSGRGQRLGTKVLTVVSLLALLAAVGIGVNIIFYKQAVASDSASLRDALARKEAVAHKGDGCSAPPPSAQTAPEDPRMLLDIPTIGLSAPVLAGTSDHTLDLGVGHLDTSNWPDQGSVDILAAHNATFFVRLPDLKPGDAITLTAPCRKWTYKVDGGEVVGDTTAVPRTADPKLLLVTCWPINALFTTSQRYLLTADLVAADNTASDSAANVAPGAVQTWKATLPAGLAGADLSNTATGVATGRLTTAGAPSAAWQSTPNSLNAVGAAVQLFGAAIRTGRDQHPQWWSTLAPGVPSSAIEPLLIEPKATFRSPLNLTVTVHGDILDNVALTTTVQVGTGTYRIDATATPKGNRMSLTAWKMTLTAGAAPTPTPSPAPSAAPSATPRATPKAAPTSTSAVPPQKTTAPTPPVSSPPPPAATPTTAATPTPSAASPSGLGPRESPGVGAGGGVNSLGVNQ